MNKTTSETTASPICTDSTLGVRKRRVCTEYKDAILAAIFNTAVTLSPSKRSTEGKRQKVVQALWTPG